VSFPFNNSLIDYGRLAEQNPRTRLPRVGHPDPTPDPKPQTENIQTKNTGGLAAPEIC
jgi:hypothetical protein